MRYQTRRRGRRSIVQPVSALTAIHSASAKSHLHPSMLNVSHLVYLGVDQRNDLVDTVEEHGLHLFAARQSAKLDSLRMRERQPLDRKFTFSDSANDV